MSLMPQEGLEFNGIGRKLSTAAIFYDKTLILKLHGQQLNSLKEAITKERPALANRRGNVFHQDNSRPHTSIVTRHKLRELYWELFMHQSYYSSDLAPTDYHLFLSMAKSFGGEKLTSKKAHQIRLSQFLAIDEAYWQYHQNRNQLSNITAHN